MKCSFSSIFVMFGVSRCDHLFLKQFYQSDLKQTGKQKNDFEKRTLNLVPCIVCTDRFGITDRSCHTVHSHQKHVNTHVEIHVFDFFRRHRMSTVLRRSRLGIVWVGVFQIVVFFETRVFAIWEVQGSISHVMGMDGEFENGIALNN